MAVCCFMEVGMSRGIVGRTLKKRSKKGSARNLRSLCQVAPFAAFLSLESLRVVVFECQNQGIEGRSEAVDHTQLALPNWA